MPPPESVVTALEAFRPEFTPRTRPRATALILGTILARGRRTVAAALPQMGLHDRPDFSSYRQVFNRAAWSPLRVARRLLSAVIAAFVPDGFGLTFAIDETLERRWGKKIRIRGRYRDPLASGKERSVSAGGIRWIVLALIVTVPWSRRPWALPVLSLPSPTPKVSLKLGRRHKTIAERARQMIARLRRWPPDIDLTVVGDTAYSVIELGLACRRRDVRLIAPLRLDARPFTTAPERAPGTVGRPRVAGDRPPNLDVVLADPKTEWTRVVVRWYDGADRALEIVSGQAVWYHNGMEPLPIRWVLTRDPAGRPEPRAYFSTRPDDEAAAIPAEFIKRWPIEVTFEEARAHLGVETQRQWSDRAIERETPCLLGLYSVVALLGEAVHRRRRSRSGRRPGTRRRRRRSRTSWRRCGGNAGVSWIFGHPSVTRPGRKSRGRSSIACSTRFVTPTDPYKVELSSTDADFQSRFVLKSMGNSASSTFSTHRT